MPPSRLSRYRFSRYLRDENGVKYLSDREPFAYRSFADNITHSVVEGDTLFSLAARYFSGFDRPSGLWWVIADFQPDPIRDPTFPLEIGRELVIPSVRTVSEEVFSSSRGRRIGL